MTQKSSADPPKKVFLEPESLALKFMLLSRLPFDRRAGRKHSLVYGFILDYFHSGYGDALASVRHIVACLKERDPFGRGLYIGDVHSALADLVEWGYLTQQKGSGRAASRYVPVWGDVPSVRGDQNSTGGEICIRGYPNTTVRAAPNTTATSVRESPNKDPLTVTRSLDPGTQEGGPDPAAASPTTAPGALAAPAGDEAAGDSFEAVWRAYGYRQDKAKARAAYVKMNPSPDLHDAMVTAAKAWREDSESKGTVRKRLDKWIAEELYDCDPPTGYRPKAGKPTPAPAPANDNAVAAEPAVTPPSIPRGSHRATVADACIHSEGGSKMLRLTFEIGGEHYRHEIAVESPSSSIQDDGQRELDLVCYAVGLGEVSDESQLVGVPFILTVSASGAFRYARAEAA
ncbi:hypothetical protein [Amorphus orientalis]|uniref:Uncharacterized protein n=1 Tax=Amorphus orientalis TaxID=649198 RepID=A0AAE4ASV5_9HYPH|nr:hypothetical protein [Amorphus orientalis]MDQ0315507.1 hypothetical protein [Amorphus orientalis]